MTNRVDEVVASTETRPSRRHLGGVGAIVVVLALVSLPFVLSDYRVFQATLVIVSAIALLGLNLLTGFGGQISLGHGALFGIGAYVAAILIQKWSLPYGLAIVGAACVCFVTGFLFGL